MWNCRSPWRTWPGHHLDFHSTLTGLHPRKPETILSMAPPRSPLSYTMTPLEPAGAPLPFHQGRPLRLAESLPRTESYFGNINTSAETQGAPRRNCVGATAPAAPYPSSAAPAGRRFKVTPFSFLRHPWTIKPARRLRPGRRRSQLHTELLRVIRNWTSRWSWKPLESKLRHIHIRLSGCGFERGTIQRISGARRKD